MVMADHGDVKFVAALGRHGKEVVGAEMVDEHPGAEEEQGLESGMGGQMKVPRQSSSPAARPISINPNWLTVE